MSTLRGHQRLSVCSQAPKSIHFQFYKGNISIYIYIYTYIHTYIYIYIIPISLKCIHSATEVGMFKGPLTVEVCAMPAIAFTIVPAAYVPSTYLAMKSLAGPCHDKSWRRVGQQAPLTNEEFQCSWQQAEIMTGADSQRAQCPLIKE